MTKALVEGYHDNREEWEELREKVRAAQLEQPEEVFPLGMEAHRRLLQLAESLERAQAFAESLPFGKRKLVQAVMKHGTRWDVIRRELHSYKSSDALRKEYNRIFKKF